MNNTEDQINLENEELVYRAIGKKLLDVYMTHNEFGELHLVFDDLHLMITDSFQDCCEYRHMTTDDALEDFVGHRFLGLEVRSGPDIESEYGVHEQEFLIVSTSLGQFTAVSHNEHNGYYGGIYPRVVQL